MFEFIYKKFIIVIRVKKKREREEVYRRRLFCSQEDEELEDFPLMLFSKRVLIFLKVGHKRRPFCFTRWGGSICLPSQT